MKKLNICLISLTIFPDNLSGASRVVRSLFEYLRNKGHNVKLLTGKWTRDLKDPDIIQFKIIKKRFLWFPQFNIKVARFLRKYNFDIIHGDGAKGTLPIILANKKKFISTIHDLGPFETKFTKIPIEKLFIKYVASKATSIITVSNFIKNQFHLYMPKISPEKIHAIYNGIDDTFKPYPDAAEILKRRLGIEGPVLLYIGRIAHYKDVGNIILAYNIVKKKINNLNLVIGGTPDFMMEKQYFEWRQRYKDIYFVGYIPEEEVAHYYSMADIFITYSFASEGFGLTPVEAIACGTPVICSSILVFKEILQDSAIFVPIKNPELLASEIINLLEDENRRNDLIQKAQKFIKRYTWDVVGQNLEKIYQKLI